MEKARQHCQSSGKGGWGAVYAEAEGRIKGRGKWKREDGALAILRDLICYEMVRDGMYKERDQ